MGRAPCCEKIGLKRGRWTAEEDEILLNYIQANGEGSWRSLPKNAGLLRCGKSCRLRWINYLRGGLKRGNISVEEEELIIKLHSSLGNRWSLIAGHLPGRTDNEIKNYWNSHLSRRIHSFMIRRPTSTNSQALLPAVVVMDLANASKKKGGGGGRTSRALMKKYKKIPSDPKIPMEEKNEGGGGGGDGNGNGLVAPNPNQEKETLRISAIEGQVEERESMVLDSHEEREEREGFVITSGQCQDGGGILISNSHKSEEREKLFLCSNEEIESGLLGPYVGDIDQLGMLCSNEVMGTMDPTGSNSSNSVVDQFSDVGGNVVMGFSTNDDQERSAAGKFPSDDQHQQQQLSDEKWSSSTTTSSICFEDEWVQNWDFNWEDAVEDLKVFDEREEVLSWLWGSDNEGDHDMVKQVCDEEQLAAWLLS